MDNKQEEKSKFFNKDFAFRLLLFVASVTVIVYFMPRSGVFNYQYEKNKPWKYSQLIATFDFPIYKDNYTVGKERDSLMASFEPYFRINKTVESEAIKRLKDEFVKNNANLANAQKYTQHIEKALREIYSGGVITSEDEIRLREEGTKQIMLIDNNRATPRAVESLTTTKRAYEHLMNEFKGSGLDISKIKECSVEDCITNNIFYEKEKTEVAKSDVMSNYSWANGVVVTGQKIIDRGEIIDANTFDILESLKKESVKRYEKDGQTTLILLGQILFVSIILLYFMLYIDLFKKEFYTHKGSLYIIFTLIVFYCVATALLMKNSLFSVYIIPYAMLPVIVRILLDSRTAFLSHVVTILICSMMLKFPHEFILTQVAAGLVAIFSLKELHERSQIFKTALVIIATYVLVYFSFELMTETKVLNDISKLNHRMYIYFVINGVLLLFTYPLLLLFEKIFGFTSNVTLVELSNINHPLLRRMSEEAPGTFQHSMQMANLASEAARSIGGNSQLVRTGALYHDIGKMLNPAFFTENQSAGINPHKDLPYEESARIVISHVTDGVKLAEKHNIPQAVKDFITTHHGKGKTKYFYISWKNEHNGEEPPEDMFSYPGPNPFTKETAILMMADSVEAASRSLPEYTEESISNLVEKIIDSQVAEGYFKECPITFKDIATVKEVFKKRLKISYHTRISYPELKKTKK